MALASSQNKGTVVPLRLVAAKDGSFASLHLQQIAHLHLGANTSQSKTSRFPALDGHLAFSHHQFIRQDRCEPQGLLAAELLAD